MPLGCHHLRDIYKDPVSREGPILRLCRREFWGEASQPRTELRCSPHCGPGKTTDPVPNSRLFLSPASAASDKSRCPVPGRVASPEQPRSGALSRLVPPPGGAELCPSKPMCWHPNPPYLGKQSWDRGGGPLEGSSGKGTCELTTAGRPTGQVWAMGTRGALGPHGRCM